MKTSPRPDRLSGSYLVTGSSGVGKTTIAELLSAHGYNAVDADTTLGEWVDANGDPVEWVGVDTSTEAWLNTCRWVFNGSALTSAIREHANDHLFVCGVTRNQHEFYHLFTKIFFLDSGDGEHKENSAVFIDATQSPEEVVTEILHQAALQ